MQGLMQQVPLAISSILRHAEQAHPDREIVSRLIDGSLYRYDYARFGDRVARAANMLMQQKIRLGDRVSTLAWNTHRHMELFFAAPGIGAVLHTANPRLSDEQIAFTIRHAGSLILFYDASFADLVTRLRSLLPGVRTWIRLGEEGAAPQANGDRSYEALLDAQPTTIAWPVFDENSAAFLCYTSGTTGNPKGVLYSHRSVVLHAMAAGLSGALGFTAFDCIMPCQSLYHATAWGLPFTAAINGCKVVLPADRFDGASLQQLIRDEGVTFSGGVPTIWTMYLDYLRRSGEDTCTLRQLVIGGSAVPRSMAEMFERTYGVAVRQIWGMTETSPLGVLATPTAKLAAAGEDVRDEVIWTRQGRRQFGIEIRIVDEDRNELPEDGETPGALLVRGPWVVERYFRSEVAEVDSAGWFDTGDIATIDRFGFMRITDRKKDVIKSGGEWVSSIDVENVAVAHPAVAIAAVVGVPHPKWEERPILVVELHEGATLTAQMMLEHLSPHMPKWWLPDAVIEDCVPLTATGKIDKKTLRDRYADHLSGESGAR